MTLFTTLKWTLSPTHDVFGAYYLQLTLYFLALLLAISSLSCRSSFTSFSWFFCSLSSSRLRLLRGGIANWNDKKNPNIAEAKLSRGDREGERCRSGPPRGPESREWRKHMLRDCEIAQLGQGRVQVWVFSRMRQERQGNSNKRKRWRPGGSLHKEGYLPSCFNEWRLGFSHCANINEKSFQCRNAKYFKIWTKIFEMLIGLWFPQLLRIFEPPRSFDQGWGDVLAKYSSWEKSLGLGMNKIVVWKLWVDDNEFPARVDGD